MRRKSALIPLASGVEEIEAVATADVLRRADVEVTLAALPGEGEVIEASRGVRIVPDGRLEGLELPAFDLLVLPGGAGGTRRLRREPLVVTEVARRVRSGELLAAICAAPTVLVEAGVASGRRVAAHPSVHAELERAGAVVVGERVVEDGALVTSMGPGTAIEFALRLVARLGGEELAAELARAMVV